MSNKGSMAETNEYAVWINDLLETVSENPVLSTEELLCQCGRSCARRKGHLDNIAKIKPLAAGCKTRRDYVGFLNKSMPVTFVEEEDGIVFHLGNEHCHCPMVELVKNPALCHCTQGSNRATWSEFFGKPVEVDIVETILRGGKECVFKIRV